MKPSQTPASRIRQGALVALFSVGFLEAELVKLGPLTLSSTEIVIGIFVLAIALSVVMEKGPLPKGGWISFGLLLFAGSLLASAIFCERYQGLAFKYAIRFFVSVVLYLALVSAFQNSQDRRLAFATLAVATCLFSIVAVIEHFRFDLVEPLVTPFRSNIFVGIPPPAFFSSGVILEDGEVIIRSSSVFLHSNILGYFLAMAAMLLIASLRIGDSSKVWGAASGSLLLFWYALTFTYSRGAFLALVVPTLFILGYLGVHYRSRLSARLGKYRGLAVVATAVALVVFVSNPLFLKGIENILPSTVVRQVTERVTGMKATETEQPDDARQKALTSRIALWGAAWNMWKQSPWLGVGPDNFRMLFYENLDQPDEDLTLNKGVHRAHNLFFNVLAEQGIVGVSALLFLLVTILVAVWSGFRQNGPSPETLGLAGAFLAFLIGNLFDTIFYYHIYMIIILALLASWTVLSCKQEEVR